MRTMSKHRSKKMANSPAATDLPNDLLMEMLSWLPVKSIFKCRSVSKAWRSLLSDDKYWEKRVLASCMTHLFFSERMNEDGKRVLIDCISVEDDKESNRTSALLSLKPTFQGSEYKAMIILDVCNGLVLLCVDDLKSGQYVVWNPATKSYVKLPVVPNASEKDDAISSILASILCDPRKSHHFKVVCFFPTEDPSKFVLAIFSSEEGEWVFSNDILTNPLPERYISGDPVFLHGALYVLLPTTHIVQFDFCKHTFQVIELPGSEEDDSSVCLGVSKGCLYYAIVCDDGMLRVWMLQNFSTRNWALRHTVLVEELVSKLVGEVVSNQDCLLNESCFHRDKEAIYFKVGTSIFCYEMSLGIVNILHKCKQNPDVYVNGLYAYSPSLLNLFDGYNFDDVRKKQSVKKQWRFKNVGEN